MANIRMIIKEYAVSIPWVSSFFKVTSVQIAKFLVLT